MKKAILFELAMMLTMYMILQVWVITPEQHLISIGVVGIALMLYRFIKKADLTNNSAYTMSKVGIHISITAILSIIILGIISQSVFVRMNTIENGIAITMGIIFYTLFIESAVIFPYEFFKHFSLKKSRFIIK